MSDESDPFEDMSRRMSDAQNLFTKMWTDMGSKLMDAGMASPPGMPTPDGARQMRTAFFRAWADYCDELMRSPEFLETMKQSMAGAVEFRRQLNESLGKMHHEFQGTSRQDVDHLMQSMAHVERRVLNAVEGLSDQLEEVNARLDALEGAAGTGAARKRPAPKKKAAAKKRVAPKKGAAAKKKAVAPKKRSASRGKKAAPKKKK